MCNSVLERRGYSHSDTRDGVCRIPETNVAGVLSTCWGVPWHNEKVQLDANVKDNNDMPCSELWLGKVRLLSAPANDVNTNCHCQVEGSGREHSEVIDCSNISIASTTLITGTAKLTECESISSRDC